MSTVTTKELQTAWGGISRKEAIRRARESGAAWREEGKSFVWEVATLPSDLQIKLTGNMPTRPQCMELPKVFLATPEKYRHIGLLRASLINRYLEMEKQGVKINEFVEMYTAGAVCPAIKNELGEVSIKTFYKWLKDWKNQNSGGLDGVTPKWGQNRAGAGSQALNDFEQGVAKAMWLTQNKPAAAKVARDMREIYGCQASEATVRRFLDSIDPHIASHFRDGKSKFEAKFFPSIETDPARYESMGMVISDHHTWDFIVDLNGQLVRPTITVFQDYRSRKILGWAHSVNPSTVSITEALVMMVVRYGAPGVLHIDNGKDYRSNYLNGQSVELKGEYMDEVQEHEIEGVFAHLGIRVIFALPYHGQSKPIERTFGTMAGDFAKEMPSYVGSNSVTRPEEAHLLHRRIGKLEKRECLITWESYMAAWEAYVEHFNATWSHSGKGMEGKTPSLVFSQNWKTRRHVSPEYLEIALAKTEVRKVTKNGIVIGKTKYWAPALAGMVTKQVMVKQSFIDVRRATVYDMEGRFLSYAEADYFAETDDLAATTDKVGEARKRIMNQVKEFAKTVPVLEEGKRGITDFALANQGVWKDQPAPMDLKIVQVAGGGFELPPSAPNLRLSEETKAPKGPKYKDALDQE